MNFGEVEMLYRVKFLGVKSKVQYLLSRHLYTCSRGSGLLVTLAVIFEYRRGRKNLIKSLIFVEEKIRLELVFMDWKILF